MNNSKSVQVFDPLGDFITLGVNVHQPSRWEGFCKLRIHQLKPVSCRVPTQILRNISIPHPWRDNGYRIHHARYPERGEDVRMCEASRNLSLPDNSLIRGTRFSDVRHALVKA